MVGSEAGVDAVPRYTKDKVGPSPGARRAGAYRAVIDRTYPLADAADATRYVKTQQKTGNVVLTVSSA